MLRFLFNEKRGLEALVYIATKWPGVTVLVFSKILFFAEKKHMNEYGRPIVGDSFVAMHAGPVPSALYDFIKGKLDLASDPQAILAALNVGKEYGRPLKARREPDTALFAPSDIECLDAAIDFCRDKAPFSLSDQTHLDPAWAKAERNGEIDYADMLYGENRDEKLVDAQDFAAYGVL